MQALCQCASWQPIEGEVVTSFGMVYINLYCAKCRKQCGKRLMRRKLAEAAFNLMATILSTWADPNILPGCDDQCMKGITTQYCPNHADEFCRAVFVQTGQ